MATPQEKLRAMALASAAKLTAEKMPELEGRTSTMTDRPHPPPPPPPPAVLPAALSKRPILYASELDAKRVRQCLNLDSTMAAASLKAADTNKDSADAPPLSSVSVPAGMVGMIVGKKGANIRHFESQYGVLIQVTNESMEPGQKTICLVGGTEENQAKIIDEILGMVYKKTHEHEYTETLEVPTRYGGLIVGSKGEAIKALEAKTNTRIQLSQEITPADTKILTLKSFSLENLAQARQVMELQLLRAFRRDKIYNAPLETKYQPLPPPTCPPPHTEEPADAAAQEATGITPADVLAAMEAAEAAGSGPFVACPPNQLGLTGELAAGHAQELLGAPKFMDGDSVGGEYYEAISQWAAFYAREPACVAYYTSLRSQAAQAFCGEAPLANAGA